MDQMSSLNLRLAQQIPGQRQRHQIVYYQLPKLRKPRTLGPPEDERSFLQNRRKQRIRKKSILLPPIPWMEKNPSEERWDRGKEKNKASNGEKVWLRTGRLTPATFTEAAETLTGSWSTRNPEKDWDESPTDIGRVGPQGELGRHPPKRVDELEPLVVPPPENILSDLWRPPHKSFGI